jgi:hypothetical protein
VLACEHLPDLIQAALHANFRVVGDNLLVSSRSVAKITSSSQARPARKRTSTPDLEY